MIFWEKSILPRAECQYDRPVGDASAVSSAKFSNIVSPGHTFALFHWLLGLTAAARPAPACVLLSSMSALAAWHDVIPALSGRGKPCLTQGAAARPLS